MKILAINGSHRGDRGHTRFLLDHLFAGASSRDADCQIVTLAGLKINRCLACGKCHTEGQYLRCVYDGKDDVREIFNQMAEADLLVFATPVYIFQMSGLMKTFLDRMYGTADVNDLRVAGSGLFFHHVDRAISSKPFVPLICCDNIESATPRNVIDYFRTYSRFNDAPQVGLLVRNAGRLAGHGHDPEAFTQAPRLASVYLAYEQAGRELASSGRISKTTQKKPTGTFCRFRRRSASWPVSRFFKPKMIERARTLVLPPQQKKN